MKKPRGGSWYTPGLLTRYAILGNRQFAGSEDTGSAYVLTTGVPRGRGDDARPKRGTTCRGTPWIRIHSSSPCVGGCAVSQGRWWWCASNQLACWPDWRRSCPSSDWRQRARCRFTTRSCARLSSL